VIDADEEEKGRFDRNDEDVGMGFIYTDLEQPLEKLLGWSGEVSCLEPGRGMHVVARPRALARLPARPKWNQPDTWSSCR